MIRAFIIAGALILTAPALAQPQQLTPMQQALNERLGIEINANVQAAAMIIDLQRQLAAAQAKIKEYDEAAASKDAQPLKKR